MTARGDLDLVLGEWMTATAHVVEPEGLHERVVARVPAIRQRPAWRAGRAARGFGQGGRASARGLSLVAAIAAVTVAGLVWSLMPGSVVPNPSASPPGVVPPTAIASPPESAPSSPTPPSERTKWFGLPFDYVIPAKSGLVVTEGHRFESMVAWATGPTASGANYAGQDPARQRGIVVAYGERAWAHGVGGRTPISEVPSRFLAELESLANMEVGSVTEGVVDGSPALLARVIDDETNQIHIGPINVANSQPFAIMTLQSELTVFEVGETTIFIQVWAQTVRELDAFLPTAHEFVDSIDFVEPPVASPVSSTGRTAQFVVPFDYAIPAGSGLARSQGDPHRQFAAWVVGEESPAPSQLYAGQSVDSGVERGIVLAAGSLPWAHGPDGRFFLATQPADLLADLRDTAGIDLDSVTPLRLDGRPAHAALIRDHAATDIHVQGPITGLTSGPFVVLSQPCRLIVSRVNDEVVFVVVWAQTAEDLDDFLPKAMEFVDSIHFVDAP